MLNHKSSVFANLTNFIKGGGILKKAVIIFVILFIVTLLIPAVTSFINVTDSNSTKELATLFNSCVSSFASVHLFY